MNSQLILSEAFGSKGGWGVGGREIANWIIRDIRNLQRVFFFNIKQLSELVSL